MGSVRRAFDYIARNTHVCTASAPINRFPDASVATSGHMETGGGCAQLGNPSSAPEEVPYLASAAWERVRGVISPALCVEDSIGGKRKTALEASRVDLCAGNGAKSLWERTRRRSDRRWTVA